MIGNTACQRKRGPPGSASEPAQTSCYPVVMAIHINLWPQKHMERGIGV